MEKDMGHYYEKHELNNVNEEAMQQRTWQVPSWCANNEVHKEVYSLFKNYLLIL